MKKYWLLILSFSFIIFGYAQSFKWKPTIGINTSIQNVPSFRNNKSNLSYDIGILMEMPLKQNMALEVGYLFSKNKASLQRTIIYPPNFIIFDTPQLKEYYTLNLLRVPVLLLFKQNKSNPLVLAIGTIIKYNISSKREGEVIDRPERYSTTFIVDTKSESRFGFGIQTSFRKEFNIENKKVCIGLNYDVDLSNWRYPTNLDFEDKKYYSLKSHNFSIIAAIEL
jgi:hypothetical protein